MNPLDTLTAALWAEPDDDAARCAYIDELMEQRGMSLRGAQSLAGRTVNAARNARDVARVVAMLDDDSPRRKTVRNLVMTFCPDVPRVSTPIEVVPGNRPPVVVGEPMRCEYEDGTPCFTPVASFGAGIPVRYTPDTRRVVVGARWVLSYES